MANPEQKVPSHGPLNLNSASEEQIAEIDMIGRKIAHEIVARRPFDGWEDVKAVPGVDAMKLAELQRAAKIQN